MSPAKQLHIFLALLVAIAVFQALRPTRYIPKCPNVIQVNA